MKKYLILSLLLFLFNGICLSQTNNNVTNETIKGNWILIKMTFDGKEDLVNHPIKNDELVLNANFTFIMTDKLNDYAQKGKWKLVNKKLELNDVETNETQIMEITELSATTMTTKIVDENRIILMYFRK